MKKLPYIVLIVIVILGFFYFSYVENNEHEIVPPKACTMEAKMCPDGSSVSRVLPDCEFSACPVSTNASTIKTIVDKTLGIQYSYVDNFYINNELTTYVHPQSWPPILSVENKPLTCSNSGNQTMMNGKTENVIINGRNYCVIVESEGAAGSTYTTYTYKKELERKTISMNFVVRMPQCMNYDEPNQTNCKNEQSTFDVAGVADATLASVEFLK